MYYRNNENYYSDNLDKRKVMVSIHCIAYNQEKYIRDTLDGFVMQKTDFPFVAVVHDMHQPTIPHQLSANMQKSIPT